MLRAYRSTACALLSLFVLAGPTLAAGPVANRVTAAVPATAAQPVPAPTAVPGQPKLKPLPPGVVQIQLVDLHCKTCARKVAGKLYAVPGVIRVRADLKRDLLTITVQRKKRVSAARLWDAVIAAKLAPIEVRVAAKRLTVKDFPKAKQAAKSPHGTPIKH